MQRKGMAETLAWALAIAVMVLPVNTFALKSTAKVQQTQGAAPSAQMMYKGVPYLSGGVGLGEREHLQEMHKNYNLKLMFARTDGDYLAEVNVVVENAKGAQVLKADSVGPWLYTKLPPGKYEVMATTAQGSTVKQTVHVNQSAMTDVLLYWKK